MPTHARIFAGNDQSGHRFAERFAGLDRHFFEFSLVFRAFGFPLNID